MHSHNHVMDPFNPQVPVQMFDQMKISIASPEKILSWSYGEIKKPKPSTTARSSRSVTVCSARAFLGRSRTMSACAASTSA